MLRCLRHVLRWAFVWGISHVKGQFERKMRCNGVFLQYLGCWWSLAGSSLLHTANLRGKGKREGEGNDKLNTLWMHSKIK